MDDYAESSTTYLNHHHHSAKSDVTYLTPPSDIELQHITVDERHGPDFSNDRAYGSREFSLPPVDRGKDAWLLLMGAFVLEMVVWGRPFL